MHLEGIPKLEASVPYEDFLNLEGRNLDG